MKRLFILLAIAASALLGLSSARPQPVLDAQPPRSLEAPPFLRASPLWADSVLSTLSLDERIAQLMMVAAYSNKGEKHEREIEALIRDRNIGGLIFFQGGPARQARLTNRYQSLARTPILIGMDLEWGLGMRLDSTMKFPHQMALGAVQDDALIAEMGEEIARQMKRLGVHVSFSPVVDVNNNPANPVINDRSFGEDRENVARKGIAYMRGLQQGGVIATAKHFPGHGDVDSDSHLTLPLIAHSRTRLDSLELYPFQRLVDEGLSAMMVAHLEVPALDSSKGLPSTLSRPIVNDLLASELGFKGLVFTDALNMKGVANADKPGEIELRALLAGNDVLLFPQDPVKAIARIRKAVDDKELDPVIIDHKCLKLLRAKQWAGLDARASVKPDGIHDDLNTKPAEALRRKLYAGAITVIADHKELLPLRDLAGMRIASVVIGDTLNNTFQRALSRYSDVKLLRCEKALKKDSLMALLRALEGYDRVIVSVHRTSWRVKGDFGIPETAMDIVREIAARKPTVLTLFANPYRLTRAYGAHHLASIVVAYEENDDTQELAAQAIFGAIGANGRLPVTASSFYQCGDGRTLQPIGRMGYKLPEELGIRSEGLAAIKTIVQDGIKARAYPGAQVVVAVDGQVVLNEAYGHSTYAAKRLVRTDDLYDLASITKVASTTLALMKLVDEGKVELDKPLGHYLTEIEGDHPAHARMSLRDILTHQAGLKPFVPFQNKLMKNGAFKPGVASDTASATHGVRVAEGLYVRNEYRDSLLHWVLSTPLEAKGNYVYSDMGYYLLQEMIERITGTSLDQYVRAQFYNPLGATTLTYRPHERFAKTRIAPTEDDKLFRQRLVWGDVHDPGAAIKGGVAGHAGLFGSANDLAKVMQMLANGGEYSGKRYISETVVNEFTKCQFCAPNGTGNRRGLGWDKPVRSGKGGPTCACVSYASFGHTGFTGTMAWVDPEQKVVYIFLSNRVNPSAEVNKLAELGIRTQVQEVVHAAVMARQQPQALEPKKMPMR